MDHRRRILTRLAWLDLSQVEFCRAISLAPSSFSQTLSARHPRLSTRIKLSTSLDVEEAILFGDGDPVSLLSVHPALAGPHDHDEGVARFSTWYSAVWSRF
jgi:hypothetical protein